MSGALSTTLRTYTIGLEAASAINALEFGATGGVVLGDFSFSGFEVPAQINFGGKQAMTVHHLPGGERVVDLLGSDDRSLDWSGTFINSTGVDIVDFSLDIGDHNPAARARRLDQMRADGQQLPLVWGDFFYTVIIDSFEAETRYEHVAYRISCFVLRNEATAPATIDTGTWDLTGSTTDDLSSAAGAVA